MIRELPADSSIEDIQCHLYMLEKLRRGQDSIRAGRGVTHQQARAIGPMAYRVIWSPEALDDIEASAAYIARDSEFDAATVAHGRRQFDPSRVE